MGHTFTAKIEHVNQPGGWYYVSVPAQISIPLRILAVNFGFIAITVTVGGSSWQTSLLPKGDGTHCIPLPAKVRTEEKLSFGAEIEIFFETRERKKH